ncbi:MAG: hypothetical protein HJJLKODD_00655 [Phycisphaerae bacterium]|nr:hypothetical protein [Phycisphaerae bacterium]
MIADKTMFEIYREGGGDRRYRVVYFTELDEHNKHAEINRALSGEHIFDGFLHDHSLADAKQIIQDILTSLNSSTAADPSTIRDRLQTHLA